MDNKTELSVFKNGKDDQQCKTEEDKCTGKSVVPSKDNELIKDDNSKDDKMLNEDFQNDGKKQQHTELEVQQNIAQ